MTRSLRMWGAAALVSALSSVAAGDIITGNFSAGVGVGTAFGGTATTQYKTFGFTMPGSSYFLDNVILSLNFAGGGTPRVAIWSGATAPATELTVLNNPPNLTGQGDFTFTPASAFTLEAGQTYWVYVTAVPVSGGPNFSWDGTSPSTIPSGIATSVGFIFNGAPSTFNNRLQVNGTPVPAPAALSLLGLAGLAATRRRRA